MGFSNKVKVIALAAGLSMAGVSQAQSPKPVNIGVMTDMSGLYSQIGGRGSVVAAQMAVDDFGGEIFGRPIKVLSADHLNKPDVAAARAREWVDRDGVVMMTDVLGSATGLAVQNLLAEKDFVIMNTGTATSAITNKNCSPYSTHWSYDTQAIAASSAAVTTGGRTSGMVTMACASDLPGKLNRARIQATMKAAGRATMIAIPATRSDRDTICQTLLSIIFGHHYSAASAAPTKPLSLMIA